MSESIKIKAFLLGIAGSFFFSFTFVLNRSMNVQGGYWMYSAILRYLFTLPILFVLLLKNKKYSVVLNDIKKKKVQWFLWSTVGFGLFYLPLTAASLYAESWFTCALWQITIVIGILLTPLFGKKIPVKNVCCSCLILAGIMIIQIPNMKNGTGEGFGLAFLLVIIGALSYPLGNRKIMTIADPSLTTIQRVFGMTLCSMPFWLICGIIAMINAGLPEKNQCVQSFGVAVFSGVIATILFFKATDMVKSNARMLATIEATQCGEVLFTLILGILVLKDNPPTAVGFIGIAIIVAGMILTNIIRD